MIKQYKPGQFVWIDGKQHRVTKASSSLYSCMYCPYRGEQDCAGARLICIYFFPMDCYPKPV